MKRKKPSGLCGEKKKRKRREGEGTRWELAVDRLCNVLCSAIGWARRPRMSAHFMQTFHCSRAAIATETKPPQQLCYCWMAAKGEPGAGLERARWVEWLIRSKLLYQMHIVTQIRESRKRCSCVAVAVRNPSAFSARPAPRSHVQVDAIWLEDFLSQCSLTTVYFLYDGYCPSNKKRLFSGNTARRRFYGK